MLVIYTNNNGIHMALISDDLTYIIMYEKTNYCKLIKRAVISTLCCNEDTPIADRDV